VGKGLQPASKRAGGGGGGGGALMSPSAEGDAADGSCPRRACAQQPCARRAPRHACVAGIAVQGAAAAELPVVHRCASASKLRERSPRSGCPPSKHPRCRSSANQSHLAAASSWAWPHLLQGVGSGGGGRRGKGWWLGRCWRVHERAGGEGGGGGSPPPPHMHAWAHQPAPATHARPSAAFRPPCHLQHSAAHLRRRGPARRPQPGRRRAGGPSTPLGAGREWGGRVRCRLGRRTGGRASWETMVWQHPAGLGTDAARRCRPSATFPPAKASRKQAWSPISQCHAHAAAAITSSVRPAPPGASPRSN